MRNNLLPEYKNIEEFLKKDNYSTYKKYKSTNQKELIKTIIDSGLTGRGGANFPTGIKIQNVFNQTGEKYIICNADEGEPGNFKDKFIMENYPYLIIEGLLLLSYILNTKNVYIYIREEYSASKEKIIEAINKSKSTINFEIKIYKGAGSYLCGEESALISSIEGKKGKTKKKPPFPTEKGLYNSPTLLLNVETIASIPFVLNNKTINTRLISLSGNTNIKGVFEVTLDTTINYIIKNIGKTPKDIKMIQLGGPSGPIIPYNLSSLKINELQDKNLDFGAGAIIAISKDNNLLKIIKNNIRFFKHESCGKCTPCREGLSEIVLILNKFINNNATKKDLINLELLSNTIKDTSFCGLGKFSVSSILSSLKYFKEEFVINEVSND